MEVRPVAQRRLKVVVINQPMDMLLPPHQNSIGIWTHKTAPFVAREHEVLVIGKRSEMQREWNGDDGVRYEFLPPAVPNRKLMQGLDAVIGAVKNDHLPSYASRLAYLDYAAQAAVAARRFGADIVHIHNFSQFVPTVRRLCPGARIVLHMACEWLNQLDFEVIDRRLGDVDLVVGCSDHITTQVAARFPHHAHRCTTVYNGVDVDRFGLEAPAEADTAERGDTDSTLLFVGRVSPEKGVHDLIDAFVVVADEIPDVRLDIVGPIGSLPREFIVDVSDDPQVSALAMFYESADGDDYELALRRRIPAYLEDRVRLLGGIPQNDLVARYREAALLVNPSYSESFGMSLVEAMACGTPFVATRIGGMIDVAGDGEPAGVLVERGDTTELARTLVELLRNPEWRESLGLRGRERVLDLFSWESVAASLIEGYERCAGHVGA